MQTHGSYAGRAIDPAAPDATAQFMEGDAALAESKVELMEAFQELIKEGKLFLKSTAGVSGEAVQGARQRFASRLSEVADRWGDWSQTARVKTREVAIAADDYVHEKPWLAVALVAGAAFVIAALTTRR